MRIIPEPEYAPESPKARGRARRARRRQRRRRFGGRPASHRAAGGDGLRP
jgi:hypothetical protein